MLSIGSLFSGIGGLELGLEWSGLGRTVWQVEQNEKCRNVLARHWPNANRSVIDVRSAGATNLQPVDLICGGFPCQDVSSAGKRAGLSGARSGLWYDFARIVDELRPWWVVIENVASGAGKWVDSVRGDLERIGYASLPIPLSASDVGAPHERPRVFIIGCNANGYRKSMGTFNDEVAKLPLPACSVSAWDMCERLSVANGVPRKLAWGMRAYGNAVVPQCAEVIGHVILQLIAQT